MSFTEKWRKRCRNKKKMLTFAFDMKKEYQKLLNAIEQEVGKKVATPKDFEWLADKVEARTKEHLSESTLMRLWGYRTGVSTRQSTLDILSRFLGYADYMTFCQWRAENKELQSDEVVGRYLYTEELTAGTRLVLTWYPDRRCVIRLLADGMFTIVEAVNTKLSAGDTFRCDLFIEGEPLYMSQLVHEGRPPMVYVVGKVNGIRFDYLAADDKPGDTDCSA